MKYKILIIVYPKIGGCQYYRQTHPHEIFSQFKDFEITYRYDFTLIPANEFKEYHLVLFHKNYVTHEILIKINSLGVKTMVDFDDYWYLPPNHLSFEHYKSSNQSKKFIEILRLANYISVTTPLLAKEVKKLNPNIFVLPNVLNPDNPHSRAIKIECEKLRFGYIGGSCHLPDIELLRGLNNKLTNAGLQYSLNLFGYKHNSVYFDYASVLTDNANHTDNLTLYPSLPVPDYLLFYNMIDVSLIPLVCNKFNSLKSELKLVEAGIFRKAVISSNVEPYQPFLKDKINCRITNSRTDWFKKMKYLVNNPELANDLGIQLHNDIQKHFNYEKISNYRSEVYKDIIQKG